MNRVEDIAHDIIQAAFEVHKILGPGLLESVYELNESKRHAMNVKATVTTRVFKKECFAFRCFLVSAVNKKYLVPACP